ncbi:DnaJ domain-containing protein [Herminiimonas sp. KBW02]|uniref:DnaJ domain-containing protein n=1 Tax=Herminiimonas sp. KBW02 TaxID=2153363 RepID=UPI001315A5CA|nr:DnaJ domain-containing protein [Herminiimonas sp. KBW02]
MGTLYEVLGVSRQATSAEIERAHIVTLAALAIEPPTLNIEERDIREKVIREAYTILSSPHRRAAYDEKLRSKVRPTESAIVSAPFPWTRIIAAMMLVVGCLYVYQVQADKAEVEVAALEVQKAEAEAERAEQLALAEQVRLERQKLQEKRAIQAKQDHEIAQIRRDERLRLERLQRMEAQASQEPASAIR